MALLSPNIDEPFEWQKLNVNGQKAVYFKSQNPYTYSEAIQYCNRQEIDEKSTGVGIHSSQLWKFDKTTETLINKQGIWTSPKDVTWDIKRLDNWKDNKGKIGYKVAVSVKKTNIPLDDNKKATKGQ